MRHYSPHLLFPCLVVTKDPWPEILTLSLLTDVAWLLSICKLFCSCLRFTPFLFLSSSHRALDEPSKISSISVAVRHSPYLSCNFSSSFTSSFVTSETFILWNIDYHSCSPHNQIFWNGCNVKVPCSNPGCKLSCFTCDTHIQKNTIRIIIPAMLILALPFFSFWTRLT